MNILIIDDEPKARILLRNIIDSGCDFVESITEASNLKSGVALIRETSPQLVFLDIEMPNQQGTELLNYFEADEIDFEIVFTTAYSDYALRAFEMNAIDYILKPLRSKKIIDVINKVKNNYDKENVGSKFQELKKSLKTNRFEKMGLPVKDGILFVSLAEIIHIEADGMYSKFHTVEEGSLLVSKPLKYFEHILEISSDFYRPHRSHIFNLNFLKRYIKKDGNYVVLNNEHIIPVAKDKREAFLALISLQ
ncbi:MAG: response regulator [Crocinitomix sp.]|nr:response regulator [Crocinitomix sp.]